MRDNTEKKKCAVHAKERSECAKMRVSRSSIRRRIEALMRELRHKRRRQECRRQTAGDKQPALSFAMLTALAPTISVAFFDQVFGLKSFVPSIKNNLHFTPFLTCCILFLGSLT